MKSILNILKKKKEEKNESENNNFDNTRTSLILLKLFST